MAGDERGSQEVRSQDLRSWTREGDGSRSNISQKETSLVCRRNKVLTRSQARFHHHGGDGHRELEGRFNTDVPR